MTSADSRGRLRGAATYAAVAALAAAVGGSVAWMARGGQPARPDGVTTHGEWVKIPGAPTRSGRISPIRSGSRRRRP